MVKYTPPPANLDRLNAVQRYMQKGQLDRQDLIRLAILVLLYFILRPYIQKAAKWFFGDEKIEAGEKAQEEYMKKRVAKIGANEIRSGKKQGEITIEEVSSDQDVVASGNNFDNGSTLVNRKNKSQAVNEEAIVEELLNWEDEPARESKEGDKSDVIAWLDKWDK